MILAVKMALLASFILRPCFWDEQATAWARLLPHDSPEDYGHLFGQMVADGRALAYGVEGPDGRCAIVVVRVDRAYTQPELVVEGAFSVETKRDFTAEFLPQIEQIARDLGCATVRFHTARPGLIAKTLLAGFGPCEVIMRKDVRHAA